MTNLIRIQPMPAAMYEVAQSQDAIGWTEFLHGKVSTKMYGMQQAHCLLTNTNLNRDDWIVELTGKLIDISHSQWLYQNFTLHHLTKGYLWRRTEQEIQREVDRLAHTSNLDVPNESQYLLEIAVRPLDVSNARHNAYWVLAVRAARQSAKWEARRGRRLQQSRRRRPTNQLNSVRLSLQRRLSPNKAVTLWQQGDPLASPWPTQRRWQEATQCTTNSTYQVPDHIFQFKSTTHQCWRSLYSILVLILTLVSAGRPGRDAESV